MRFAELSALGSKDTVLVNPQRVEWVHQNASSRDGWYSLIYFVGDSEPLHVAEDIDIVRERLNAAIKE